MHNISINARNSIEISLSKLFLIYIHMICSQFSHKVNKLIILKGNVKGENPFNTLIRKEKIRKEEFISC